MKMLGLNISSTYIKSALIKNEDLEALEITI